MLYLLEKSAFRLLHLTLPRLLLVKEESGLFNTGCSEARLFPALGIRHPIENLVTSVKPLPGITCIGHTHHILPTISGHPEAQV